MSTFTIPDKSAVASVSATADVFPVWQSGGQHKATAAQIVASVPMVGDAGTGGSAGIVPAPAAGDAAAGRILGAGGTWTTALVNLTFTGTIGGSKSITAGATQGLFYSGTLPYSAVGNFASFNAASTTWTQVIVSNSSNTASASANIVVSNNAGTDTAYYGALGINSASFSGTACAGDLPNATYLCNSSGDLAIGTNTANAVHFFAGYAVTDAITISSANIPTINYGQSSVGASTTTMPLSGMLTTQVSAAGVSPTTTGSDYVIATYTIPANAFDVAGREVKITGFGKFAANSNTKQLKIYAGCTAAVVGSVVSGGTVISDSAALTTNGSGWRNVARILKYGAAASNTQISMQDSGTTSTALPQLLTMTESGAIIIAITGNCTTTNTDVVLHGLLVEYAN